MCEGIKTGIPDGEAPEKADRHRRASSGDNLSIRQPKRRIGDRATLVVVSNARIGARIVSTLDGTTDVRRAYGVGIVRDFMQRGDEQPPT
ncbi:hypothetical protein G7Y79_00011g031010 [Physcia stellaris]|nr:hypothetical protein G7Y79_00011g031010 [Physcia stellaris]